MIKLLELFGGIGSPRVVLRNLGVPTKCLDYVEIDAKAVISYNAIFSEDSSYSPDSVIGYNLRPDVLVHGSPCQDFSIAGRLEGADEGSQTRSSLMWETIRIIEEMGEWRPKYVIWENVKNVLSSSMKPTFTKYLKSMESLGYTNSYAILDARDFGIPQARERVFTISVLGDEPFNFDKLEKTKMRDLSHFLDNDFLPCHVVTQNSVLNGIGKTGTVKRATVIKEYAYTITTRQDRTPAQVIALPGNRFRYLTEKECWRLQGFSDKDFYKAAEANPVPKGRMNRTLYLQAGNSIAVPILESIFRVIIQDLSDKGEDNGI